MNTDMKKQVTKLLETLRRCMPTRLASTKEGTVRAQKGPKYAQLFHLIGA